MARQTKFVNSFYLELKIYFWAKKSSLLLLAFQWHFSIYDIIRDDMKILRREKHLSQLPIPNTFHVFFVLMPSSLLRETTFEMRWYFYVFPMFILLSSEAEEYAEDKHSTIWWICKINNLWLFVLFFTSFYPQEERIF